MTKETCNTWLPEMVADDKCALVAFDTDFGWLMYVPSLDHMDIISNLGYTIPDDFQQCVQFAIDHDCQFMNFDGDCPPVTELPVYEW